MTAYAIQFLVFFALGFVLLISLVAIVSLTKRK